MIVRRKNRRRRKSRSSAPKVLRRRKRRHARSNPTVPVLFANPRRRRRRAHRKLKVHRRRHARAHRHVPMLTNPRRRRVHRRAHRRPYRLHRNPGRLRLNVKSILHVLKLAAFGAGGIIVARQGSSLYSRYLASNVIGDGSSDARKVLSEVLRLASMGALTAAVEYGLRKSHMLGSDSLTAFRYGGYGEMGRQSIAFAIGKVAPGADLASYGLGVPYAIDSAPNSFRGLAGGGGGMGDLEEMDNFGEIDGDQLEETQGFEGLDEYAPYLQGGGGADR